MTGVAVVDSHALIWYGNRDWKKLGRFARELFERAEAGTAVIYVPTLALAEIGEQAWRGRILLEGGFSRWAEDLFASGSYRPADLTMEIVLRAESLYAIPERTDRLLAATALELDCPLITSDRAIARASGVDVVW